MHFAQNGRTFHPHDNTKSTIHKTLPAGTYVMKFDPRSGLYLEQVDEFVMPKKLYGSLASDADRILNTFNDRINMTGVLLSGEKGSGKTLLAKEVAIKGVAAGMPTILVNQGYAGDMFSDFVQQMHQPAVFFLDEFEKTHDSNAQQALLTLLDGVMSSKKLFLLTVNKTDKLSDFLTNRPGRLFYHFNYDGLTLEFVREYAMDTLKNASKKNVEGVVASAIVAGKFNFDQLASLVQEMNRYDENASQALKRLNVSPRTSYSFCGFKVFANNVELDLPPNNRALSADPMAGLSLTFDVGVKFEIQSETTRAKYIEAGVPTEMRRRLAYLHVDQDHLVNYDLLKGEFTYFVPYDFDSLECGTYTKEITAILGPNFEGFKVVATREAPKPIPTMSEMLAGVCA